MPLHSLLLGSSVDGASLNDIDEVRKSGGGGSTAAAGSGVAGGAGGPGQSGETDAGGAAAVDGPESSADGLPNVTEAGPQTTGGLNAGGSSILLPAAPLVPVSARVDEMRKSIAFIKERFHALKKISELDKETALEGGWTEEAVTEELIKLKQELTEERVKLKEALFATSPSLDRRGRGGGRGGSTTRKFATGYAPNLSTSSTVSASRERLFSAEVARKLERLTKMLDRTCREHERDVRRRRNRTLGRSGAQQQQQQQQQQQLGASGGLYSPLIPVGLMPSPNVLKPLFRGDRSPDGVRRQRRRARNSITMRHR